MAGIKETVDTMSADIKEIKAVLKDDEYGRTAGLVTQVKAHNVAIIELRRDVKDLQKSERKNKWWRRLQYAGSAGGGGLLTWAASKGTLGKFLLIVAKLFS